MDSSAFGYFLLEHKEPVLKFFPKQSRKKIIGASRNQHIRYAIVYVRHISNWYELISSNRWYSLVVNIFSFCRLVFSGW